MAKKSFKDNPALQFITAQEEVPADQPTAAAEMPTQRELANPPAGYKVNPVYLETKSKRVNLLMQPSVHERAKSRAAAMGVSLNEFVHIAIEAMLDGEGAGNDGNK
jgi:hypothetical protein